MFQIRPEQYDLVDARRRTDYLVEIISDWYAIYARVYGRSAALSWDEAWELVADVPPWVEGLPQYDDRDPTYELVHRVLSSAEAGAAPAQIDAGLAAFERVMPADEAALTLFDLHVPVISSEGGAV